MRLFFSSSAFFALVLALAFPQSLPAAERPVLAIAPLNAPGFADAVTAPLLSRITQLARDAQEFTVFDQGEIDTILRFQKQGAGPVVADPVALGKMVAARKVLTIDLRRMETGCGLNLKITDVETGVVEATRFETGACDGGALLSLASEIWERLVTGRVSVQTDPPGLAVAVNEAPPRPTPFSVTLAPGFHRFAVVSSGYTETVTTIAVRYDRHVALRLLAPRQQPAYLQLYGSPISATVYLGAEAIGQLPVNWRLTAGTHRLLVATDAGRYPLTVTLAAEATLRQRVDFPFQARLDFERLFAEANHAAFVGDREAAAEIIERAIAAGQAARGTLPLDTRPELDAAIAYAQGVRALGQAWAAQADAELTGDLARYCLAIDSAAGAFQRSKGLLPDRERFGFGANQLSRQRAPFDRGVCATSARFAEFINGLRWPLGGDPQTFRQQLNENKAVLVDLYGNARLSEEQRTWIRAEQSLLAALERWGEMQTLGPQLLSTSNTTLPRICVLTREAAQFAARARAGYPQQLKDELPLAERLVFMRDLEEQIRRQASLCR